MEEAPQYPLYGSTYNVYRLSPLHHGNRRLFSDAILQAHARRMRNVLKGDTLRGVQVSLPSSDNTTSNLGPLENCTWDLIGDEMSWKETNVNSTQDETADDLTSVSKKVSPETARGIHIKLEYARHTHTALLLRDAAKTTSPDNFTYLPLLLLRMPQPIRETVLDFLATTFDTRVAPFKLRPQFLSSSFESLLSALTAKESSQSVPDTVKSLQIQLAFPSITQQLKNMDITIARDDVYEFIQRGQLLLRNAPNLYPSIGTPFVAALAHYLSAHIAIEPTHIQSGISKIVCAVFALSADGKIKLFTPAPLEVSEDEVGSTPPRPSASQLFMTHFYENLVAEATSNFDWTESPATTTTTKAQKPATGKGRFKRFATAEIDEMVRKRKGKEREPVDELADADDAHTVRSVQTPTKEAVPVDPPPPYELHDPARV